MPLARDHAGEIRRIATFLDIPIDEARWPSILEHCGFEYMKRHATRSTPLGGAFWDGGATTFIHQGTNGRWQGVLSAAESAKYEASAARHLEPACAHWLFTGELPA